MLIRGHGRRVIDTFLDADVSNTTGTEFGVITFSGAATEKIKIGARNSAAETKACISLLLSELMRLYKSNVYKFSL